MYLTLLLTGLAGLAAAKLLAGSEDPGTPHRPPQPKPASVQHTSGKAATKSNMRASMKPTRSSQSAGQGAVDPIVQPMDQGSIDTDKIVSVVSAHEGSYGAMNLNRDKAGLSFGIIQWSQKPGSLGVLLKAFNTADPLTFKRIFGPHSATLLAETAKPKNQNVKIDGHYLWESPWTDRFAVAGRNKQYRKVQKLVAVRDYMPGAEDGAKAAGWMTERMLALLYDRSVQQSPSTARRLGQAASGLTYRDALAKIAADAANRFRKTSDPRSSAWRKMADGSWHKFAGSFDLYAGITRRSKNIIEDPSLSDL